MIPTRFGSARGTARRALLALAGLAVFACGITERQVSERGVEAAAGSAQAGRAGSAHAGNVGVGGSVGGAPGFAGTAVSGGNGPFGNGGTPFPLGGMAPTGGAAFPAGGSAWPVDPDPGPSDAVCALVPDVVPTCGNDGSGGDTGDAGAASAGSAGAAGAAEAAGATGMAEGGAGPVASSAPWCNRAPTGNVTNDPNRLSIDDLEDADDLTPTIIDGGRVLGRGAWFTVNDGSAAQFPSPCILPSPTADPLSVSKLAMHTYGKGFRSEPGGYSLLGISVKAGDTCSQPLDASGFAGVEFRARGSGYVRFFMGTVETNPVLDFGTCVGRCYDSHGMLMPVTGRWQTYRVPFAQVVQEGWGTPEPFVPSHILTLQWSAKSAAAGITPAACFDFWIDDVALYR